MLWLNQVKEKSYQAQIILLIATVAIGRLVLALIIDLLRTPISPVELATDFTLLAIFVMLLVFAFLRKNLTGIHPAFGLILIILLSLNYIEFGGVHGNSRFNYYAGFFIIILLYSGHQQILLLIFQVVVMSVLSWYTAFAAVGKNLLFITFDLDYTDFVFILFSFGILSFYLKSITTKEINEYHHLSAKLSSRVSEAKQLNHELVSEGQNLERAQQHLEKEVTDRSQVLLAKQSAIKKFIYLNTEAIQLPMQEFTEALGEAETAGTLGTMLKTCHAELNEVSKNIATMLKTNEELHRTKIK